MEDKREDSASTGYARMKEEESRSSSSSSSSSFSSLNLHRQMLIGCALLVLFTLCGLLGGVIALRIHLQLTSTDLLHTEGQVFAYESVVNNLTTLLAEKKGEPQVGGTGSRYPSVVNEPSVVYFRWGASTCPSTAELIYEGVTASGGSGKVGGGSNHLCMTLHPDFIQPMAERQERRRSYIYGAEYRNGADYEPLMNLHGHDAPCAACRAMRRSTVLMIPGATSCPAKGNWTREYFGYLMAAREDLKRTNYICVDSLAEATPGSSDAYQHGDLLFPVEAYCNEGAGGGLPCSPYVDGFEITCAVCTV